MNKIIASFSILIGKIIIYLSRKLRIGGGSNFPGRVAMFFSPNIILYLAKKLKYGSVIVTATNGKTTITRMIAATLKENGFKVVYNITGANMKPGIATTLIDNATIIGKVRADIGVFEVDEGSMVKVAPQVAPNKVLIANFFRDQLDRFGEVSILKNMVRDVIYNLESKPRLFLNGDDPFVTSIGRDYSGEVVYFGIDDVSSGYKEDQTDADIRNCIYCGEFLEYNTVYFGHLGDYSCKKCSFARPKLSFKAEELVSNGLHGQSFLLDENGEAALSFKMKMVGRHVVYNTLGAVAVLRHLDLKLDSLALSFASMKPPYGRFEEIKMQGRSVYLILVKNPAGANVILRLLSSIEEEGSYGFFLNDFAMDGRDISWIYDAKFELLTGLKNAVTGGRRAADMALRLYYAGISQEKIEICKSYSDTIKRGLQQSEPNNFYIMATYTAMHKARAELARFAEVKEFWKE